MKLFKDNCETKEFADKQVLLTAIPSPFKEFIKREDYTNQSFSIGEEEPVSFSKTFVLQVNIKDSSSLYFVYLLENFNKDEIINKIAELKYMRVVDVNSAKEKTKALLKIAKEYNPLFYLYQAKNGIPLFKNELVDVVNELEFSETQFFYADKDIPFEEDLVVAKEEVEEINEAAPSVASTNEPAGLEFKTLEEPVQEQVVNNEPQVVVNKTQEDKKEKKNFFTTLFSKKEKKGKAVKEKKESQLKQYIVVDLKNIKKNKYHFIFLVVSSFLFGFAMSVGYCNAMIGKTIASLFFVCAFVGVFLNTYVFADYFKERGIKDRLFVYSIIFDIAGGLVSLLATYIFYITDKGEINNNVPMSNIVGITIGLVFAMIAVSISLAYLIDYLELKYKNKKSSTPKEDEE